LLVKGIIEKCDVLAYFGERGGQEIVSTKVSVISVTELKDVLSDGLHPVRLTLA
jgi:hypothetical protein